MRPFIAMLVAATIFGGLKLYMDNRPRPAGAADQYQEISAPGEFQLQVTLTFDAGPDAFALDTTAPSVLVLRQNQDILRRTDNVAAFVPIEIKPLLGLVQGQNEFFVQATPSLEDPLASRAVRVQILRDGQPLRDVTLWSEPGAPVEGTVSLAIDGQVAAPPSASH